MKKIVFVLLLAISFVLFAALALSEAFVEVDYKMPNPIKANSITDLVGTWKAEYAVIEGKSFSYQKYLNATYTGTGIEEIAEGVTVSSESMRNGYFYTITEEEIYIDG